MIDPPDDRRRRVQETILLHGTSGERERACRLLARLVLESGASGAALGLMNDRHRGRLAPMLAVAPVPGTLWDARLPGTVVRVVRRQGKLTWCLMLRGADSVGLQRADSLLRLVLETSAGAADPGHRPSIPTTETGRWASFLMALDAHRRSGFARATRADAHRRALRTAIDARPAGAAGAVVRALSDPARLAYALSDFGHELENDNHLREAAGIYVILYELAVLRQDADVCMDAARWAGRAFRKAAEWPSATSWYELSRRIAEHRGDLVRLVRVLDGIGNTHRERGAFPRARQSYRDAWKIAQVAGDPVERANVALGLMTVERGAGRLASAAAYGWTALGLQSDPVERANLLLNIGTLLRDGGDLDAAERAYRVSRVLARSADVRMLAADALAFCAALRGDARAYQDLRPRAARTAPYIRVQIGYFRGAALRALGDARAQRVLAAVERYARAHRLAEWEMKAALLRVQPLLDSRRAVEAPDHVRRGLRELEAALT